MKDAERVGIARVVIRSKEQLVAIRPRDGVLTMETLLFGDEVVPPEDLGELEGVDEAKATKKEVEMARQLIDSLAAEFDPSKYRDEYRDAVLEMIERKAEGQEIAVQETPEEPEEVPDLMAALEAIDRPGPSASRSPSRSRRPRRSPSAKAEAGQEEDRPPRSSSAAVEVEVEGRELRLSNLEKVLYPETGFTKGQVIDYYTRVAPGAAAPPARPRADAQALPERRRGRATSTRSRSPRTRPSG